MEKIEKFKQALIKLYGVVQDERPEPTSVREKIKALFEIHKMDMCYFEDVTNCFIDEKINELYNLKQSLVKWKLSD